ncbi:glycoside hydrolase family 88/105 protein [Pannonibacter phragmitetus]|uniref:Di-trans,poly-cis-decaprenylcistransferase n=1 Tax=Pannonibacter phragmitetus TaxID=121719 RepID=A0A0U3NCV7_9HYPH|nr:glycoside hydrolase family 88 protein [Pannonibacter phragmitetus]ALV29195.1 di-trans,poly-cis-decaprenylcistransferase [Pannonibacter phragmitetus]
MTPRYFKEYLARYTYAKDGSWCYEDGCVYRGLALLHDQQPQEIWRDELLRLIGPQVGEDGALAGYTQDEFNIDHILAGRVLFFLEKPAPGAHWSLAIEHLAGQLTRHPRTDGGNYWHKKRYPQQVWLDGLYMGLPFQIEYGLSRNRPDLVDDALAQLNRALDLTHVAATGLYAHAIDEARAQDWADPQTGLSRAHWARALGWLAMALVDVTGLIGPEKAASSGLPERASALLTRIAALARPQSGLWLQVIDQPELSGNYEESSASAMFAYALMKAARLGLGHQFAAPGLKALASLETTQLYAGDDGIVRLQNVCEMAGLGGFGSRLRDGSPAYYLSEPLRPDDHKGTGALMMAYAERLASASAEARRAAS